MAAPLPGDKKAGFMGLIIGSIAIGAIVVGITYLTNRKFDAHEGAGHPPAGQAQQSAPAGH